MYITKTNSLTLNNYIKFYYLITYTANITFDKYISHYFIGQNKDKINVM